MQPIVRDLDILQGDSRDFFFRVKKLAYNPNSGEFEPTDYEDLSNWSARSQIRAMPSNSSNNALLVEWQALITNQVTIPGGVLLRLTSAQTAQLPASAPTYIQAKSGPTTLVWDCQLVNPTNQVNTFFTGGIRVLPEVTRA